MNIVSFQHVAFETPGLLTFWAASRGHRMSTVRTDLEDPLPALERAEGLVVLGGPMGVHDDHALPWLAAEKAALRQALQRRLPTLGICLGAQLIADALGAQVSRGRQKEIGWFPVTSSDPVIGEGAVFTPLLWHGDVFTLPEGARPVGSSAACELQGFRYQDHVLALLFHLEMTRHGLTELIAECAGELDGGPTTQTPDQLLAQDAPFEAIHELAYRVFDDFFGASPG
ncbi:amidotransferase [Azoarcus sp. TTM-91]|uniref:type 1 glutamine amidotransferase n=1 Tax=Azoarcus sp. TTM-91 TaxID=2691581 RepID=UPI00145CB96D|nr:gamma-glutamyl-gamma-aminobutyrate hydrolase family protein [Azoarcus sp. TTM-91]NMG37379.1 amidotransferase [Azoarcus sp. TTM-91]